MVSRSATAAIAAEERLMNETNVPEEIRTIVDRLADPAQRDAALAELDALGPAALPAVRDGLRDGRWEVRRWCAFYFDRHPDLQSLPMLIPLLRDAKSQVRLFAVHSISCEHCKLEPPALDVVPLLIERIEDDHSIRVRRMATASLAYGRPDARAVPVFQRLLREATDRKLRLHAKLGLMRCGQAGIL
jgi:HEAT repeat protein